MLQLAGKVLIHCAANFRVTAFYVSARPYVPANSLTFTVSMRRFEQMARNMDESFLTTESWNEVKERL